MDGSDNILVLSLDDRRYALHLSVVERVLRSVEINPVPTSSDNVMGLLNLQGRIIPVLNIRRLMHLPERELDLDDRLIITRAFNRTVALPADDVSGIVKCPAASVVSANAILPGMGCVEGVAVFIDGLVLIYDLERFLFAEDGSSLVDSLSSNGEPTRAAGELEGTHE